MKKLSPCKFLAIIVIFSISLEQTSLAMDWDLPFDQEDNSGPPIEEPRCFESLDINEFDYFSKRKAESDADAPEPKRFKPESDNSLGFYKPLELAKPPVEQWFLGIKSLYDLQINFNDLTPNIRNFPCQILSYCNIVDSDIYTISNVTPSLGLFNCNGNDCFLSSALQFLRQNANFIKSLTNMRHRNDNQNELLAFFASMSEEGSKLIYHPNTNATALIRHILCQSQRGIPKTMENGVHDAQELISALLEITAVGNISSAQMFSFVIISELTLSTTLVERLKKQGFSDISSSRVVGQEQAQVLSLELVHDNLRDCLRHFVSMEQVDIFDWEMKAPNDWEKSDYSLRRALLLASDEKLKCLKSLRLGNFPETLFIHLKRFQFSREMQRIEKIVKPVSFSLILDLQLLKPAGQEIVLYELTGFIVHRGGTGGGHYWAYVLHKPTNTWYLYNDSIRITVDENDIKQIAILGNENEDIVKKISSDRIKDVGTPYLLFYSRFQ